MKRNLNIYLLTALLFILSSCSIAGSWVYERADSYLAEYFKEYANFSDEQEDEIDKVTSPKGCTIAGLNEMEHNGFSSAFIKGITVSANKAKNLYE